MMRKIGFITLMILLCFWMQTFAQQDKIPAPFAKAREMALGCEIDPELGSPCWKTKINKNGQQIEYRIYYHKDHLIFSDHIVLMKTIGMQRRSVAYHLNSNRRSRFTNETGWIVISEEECIKIGFQFFRELVENGLI